MWSRVSHSKHCTDQPMSTQKPGSHWATEWIMHSSQRCSRNSDTVGRTLVGLSNCSFLIKLQYISKQWDDCTLPCQDYRVKSELKSKAWIYSTSFPLVTRKVIFQWNIINVIIFYSNFFLSVCQNYLSAKYDLCVSWESSLADLIKYSKFMLFYQSTECAARLFCLDKQDWLSDGFQLHCFIKREALKMLIWNFWKYSPV